MDLQKEREAFEAVTNTYHCIYNADLNYYFSGSKFVGDKAEIEVNAGWKAWQAAIARMEVRINTLDEMLLNQGEALAQAKAQAVPEGFVLVEKAKLMQIIGSVSMIEPITRGNPYMDSVKRELTAITDVVKTVIKAQEPAK